MSSHDLVRFMKRCVTAPREMQDIMRKHGLKIEDLEDPMQKLAFTFYTELCELSSEAEQLMHEELDMMWWGYLHTNGSVHVKRYFGDDLSQEDSDFVQQIVGPFKCKTREEAMETIAAALGLQKKPA